MNFDSVARVFSTIEPITSRLEITRVLAELLTQASPAETSIVCTMSLGQLHPPYLRTRLNIAEKSAIKAVAQLLGHSPSDIAHELKECGDLGLLVSHCSWHASHDMTIEQVYHDLCELETIEGAGSHEKKISHLRNLLARLEPLQAKYALRIVLGQLRLGFSDMTLIDALSWMIAGNKSLRATIEKAYNVCADIGFIAQSLKEGGIEALQAMKVHIGIPLRPASAERLPSAHAIIEKIGPCVAEPKIDGFRLQIHSDRTRTPATMILFSRNLQDITHMFPDLIEALSHLRASSFICEGEAVAYDPNIRTFLPFQETAKRKRKHGIESAAEILPLRVFLFDILYLDGSDLLDEQLCARRKKLAALIDPSYEGHVDLVAQKHIDTTEELEDYFYENINAGFEGVVVKRIHAHYMPGKRNFNWIKLKRTEGGHLEDTIDCVILGYYAGSGKRTAFGVGAFLVGVFDEHHDRFETVAKIGTGLKDRDWDKLKEKCDARAVAEQPKNVTCSKDLVPDVWTTPDIVCLIRADEITLSPVHTAGRGQHAAGYALRFPRFVGYRHDKSARQATTVREIEHMFKNQTQRGRARGEKAC